MVNYIIPETFVRGLDYTSLKRKGRKINIFSLLKEQAIKYTKKSGESPTDEEAKQLLSFYRLYEELRGRGVIEYSASLILEDVWEKDYNVMVICTSQVSSGREPENSLGTEKQENWGRQATKEDEPLVYEGKTGQQRQLTVTLARKTEGFWIGVQEDTNFAFAKDSLEYAVFEALVDYKGK